MAEARGQAETWGRIPRTYVRFTLDRLVPLALQDRFINEADRLTPDNLTDVRSIAAPHFGPFDRPELVDIFAELAHLKGDPHDQDPEHVFDLVRTPKART